MKIQTNLNIICNTSRRGTDAFKKCIKHVDRKMRGFEEISEL